MDQKKVEQQLKKIKGQCQSLRQATAAQKNKVLKVLAKKLLQKKDLILKANSKDLQQLSAEANSAFRDRLTLTEARLKNMADSLLAVARWPDPVGEVVDRQVLKNGLQVRRQRSPLGVIFMIFESRPNVITEAFSLAFKSGNGFILKGGKESAQTSKVLYGLIEASLKEAGLSKDVFWGLSDAPRSLVHHLLQQKEWIDVVVPRGGEGLISYVSENCPIPIIKNDRGLCHLYVHKDGDLDMASQILENGKAQRPGVCNSLETLLIHKNVAKKFLPVFYQNLAKYKMQWWACAKSLSILREAGRLQGQQDVSTIQKAQASNYATEYLDYALNVKVVDSVDQALQHIDTYGSKHSEAIVTKSKTVGHQFLQAVDAAAVYWNASTRFTDGYEMGLGGEIGISTQKLHVRGPVGLRELTSVRWVLEGTGQIRK
ncbi:MAG: glutamate-5-semialdehyde dehydrogenase [Pseudobdellovibrionaceae bacterium]